MAAERFLSLPPARRLLGWGALALVLLLVWDVAERWVSGPPLGVISVAGQVRPQPTPAPETKIIREVERVYVDRPVEVVREVPVAVERDFNLDHLDDLLTDELEGDQLLTVVDLPALPHGGRAAVTLDPEGKTQVTTLADRPPLFDLGGVWEVAGGPMYSRHGVGARLQVSKDLARVGPVYLKAQVELDLGVINSDARGMVLAAVRF